MEFFNRHIALRRSAALFLATIVASGCMTWRPALSRSDQLIAQRPAEVRFSLEHGSQVDVYGPTVLGDYVFGQKGPGTDARRIAIPMSGVRSVERRAFNPVRTAALAGALTITGIVFVAVMQAAHAPAVKIRAF